MELKESLLNEVNIFNKSFTGKSSTKQYLNVLIYSIQRFAKWKTMVGYNRDVVDYNAYSLVIVLIGENISITIYKLEIIRQLPFTVIDQTPSRFPFNGCNLKPGKLISSISCAVSIAASCIRNLL